MRRWLLLGSVIPTLALAGLLSIVGGRNPPPPVEEPDEDITGLEFPSNGGNVGNSNSHRFRFTGSALIPIYGTGGAGVTYLWKIQPIQQTGYYSTMFWANDDDGGDIDTFLWDGGGADSYYGFHPYPPGGSSGTTHNWEISVEQIDVQNGTVVKGVWYSQAATVAGASGQSKVHDFYWDLPSLAAGVTVSRTSPSSWGNESPPSPALTFGDAPWQPNVENCSCIIRGIQIYDELLTTTEINQLEDLETNAEVLSQATSMSLDDDLWYLNMNPTPDDISDKSGAGHNPAWFNSNRPDLWEP